MTAEWDAAVSWLHAQLDREETLANAAAREAGLRWEGLEDGIFRADDPRGWPTAPFMDDSANGFLDRQLADHVASNDPAAALSHVESDRRILAIYDTARDGADHDAESEARFYLMGDVVKAFAQRYAHLPDFPEVLRLDQTETR